MPNCYFCHNEQAVMNSYTIGGQSLVICKECEKLSETEKVAKVAEIERKKREALKRCV